MNGQSPSAKMVMEITEGKENPFWTIEALQENLGMVWTKLAENGIDVWDRSGTFLTRPKGKPGELIYYLNAVDEYAQKIFQHFAALDHDVYKASDGDEEAFKRMQQRLAIIAARHQKEWEEIG